MTKVKNVVVIGGGNGAAVSLLALRRSGAQFAVSAVVLYDFWDLKRAKV
jgi:2-phospho-L-lactate transferase/gluconeogenesis factor (CofD/UPF0052 family)